MGIYSGNAIICETNQDVHKRLQSVIQLRIKNVVGLYKGKFSIKCGKCFVGCRQ